MMTPETTAIAVEAARVTDDLRWRLQDAAFPQQQAIFYAEKREQ